MMKDLSNRFILAFLLFTTISSFSTEPWFGRPDLRRIPHDQPRRCEDISSSLLACPYKQPPHAGRHFFPSHPAYGPSWRRRLMMRRRFMEGWYFRLTIPEENASFAIIISIEDPGNKKSNLRRVCLQIVGPDDTYMVKADKDDTKFWATKQYQALGYTFCYKSQSIATDKRISATTAMSRQDWNESVQSGFQITPTLLLGKVEGYDGKDDGALDGQGTPAYCEFDVSVEPVCGWGNAKSTAGWLSHFSGWYYSVVICEFIRRKVPSRRIDFLVCRSV